MKLAAHREVVTRVRAYAQDQRAMRQASDERNAVLQKEVDRLMALTRPRKSLVEAR